MRWRHLSLKRKLTWVLAFCLFEHLFFALRRSKIGATKLYQQIQLAGHHITVNQRNALVETFHLELIKLNICFASHVRIATVDYFFAEWSFFTNLMASWQVLKIQLKHHPGYLPRGRKDCVRWRGCYFVHALRLSSSIVAVDGELWNWRSMERAHQGIAH